jgi:CRISPR/Cas system-associated exonuclease Cas4 (RecB family)
VTGALRLARLRSTSPSLAETMRSCLLRAGLSRLAGSSAFVLGNPKGWLGTAYHEVLRRVLDVDLAAEPLEAAVQRLWDQAVEAQAQRSTTQPLDHRFGSPVTWPGYYVTQASVLLRAQDLVAGLPLAAPASGRRSTREQDYIACGGKLTGRPDVVRGGEVIDYKSGALMEYDEAAQGEIVKASYVRQLQLYGYLVKEATGEWPHRGVLLPLAGPGVEVQLDPVECEREAREAVVRLDEYNATVVGSSHLADLASPRPENCKACPYKLICPPFWQAVVPGWSGELGDTVVEGTVAEPSYRVHSGAALVIPFDITGGSEIPRRTQIAPLNPLTHAIAAVVAPGERLRVMGLRVQPSGALQSTPRTVIARANDLPEILLPVRAADNAQEQAVA